MDSVQGTRALPRVGFPIRKSPDQCLFSDSPRLIAAVHVLHRLLMPRHPPCALVLLSLAFFRENTNLTLRSLCSFQGTAGRRGPLRTPGARRGGRGRCAGWCPVPQSSTAWVRDRSRDRRGRAEVSICVSRRPSALELAGRARHTASEDAGSGGRAGGGWSHRIPRKEVIQPQLPLRLPCYDFTPVTDSTFDCSLPCGLGHRLRVSPASVV